METVCAGKQWDVLLACKDGVIQGALPYLCGSKLGLKYVLQPQLTQFNGPWLRPELNFDDRVKVLSDLVGQLDGLHLALYMQCFPPEVSNWLPFYWKGYRQTTRYTYRFDPLRPVAELMELAQPQRRKRISLLEEECLLDRQVEVEEFVPFHHDYYLRKAGHNLVPADLVRRLCNEALGRGNALLYGLRDKNGCLLVADFVVFDHRCAHSLLSGMSDDAPRNSTTLLFWKIIDAIVGRCQCFDFEGSMDPGIEQFFRSFGTVQTPYHCVYRSRLPLLAHLLHL